jgi:hypothetical protein
VKIIKSDRGFYFLMHQTRLNPFKEERICSESSAIGDYEDASDNPGSSYLWFGEHHHLNREEVAELVERLQGWLDTGRLAEPDPD